MYVQKNSSDNNIRFCRQMDTITQEDMWSVLEGLFRTDHSSDDEKTANT